MNMETIYYNGKIITMEEKDQKNSITNAPEAVLIRDGIIIAVGKLAEIEKLADTSAFRYDLQGKCLMPSFIDSHSHFVMNGQMSLCADLSACESYDDIIRALQNYIIEHEISSDGAVIGFGYDHNFLQERNHPNKKILDEISRDIPILILHVSGHLACANSAALLLAGINANTANPEGGIIGRQENDNEPSGYLEETSISLVQKAIVSRLQIDFATLANHLQDIYIKNGITTVQDGASTEADIRTILALNSSNQLKIDVIAYPLMSTEGMSVMNSYGELYKDYQKHFKIGGYKMILDGSPQGKTAWLSSPYLNEKDNYCGYPWMENESVENMIKQAIAENKQLLAHCNGDAASEQYLNAYEKIIKESGNHADLRPVMIHCQTVRNDQLDRMSRLKMIASIFVGHVWYWGDIHIVNLGTERGNRISPVKDALNRSVIVNFHQDAPVTKPDMLHSVWCAVNRISRKGNIIGAEQSVNVYEALKAVTKNAAYQYFEENTKGSILIGKRADLVILDKSPLEIDSIKIKDIRVMETIKDGVTRYKRI